MTVRELTTHAALLEATGDSAFIRYDIPEPLEGPAFTLGNAVALPRRTHTRRLGMLVVGPPDHVGPLLGSMLAERRIPDDLRSVTVQRGSLPAVAQHLSLADGNEWEWLCATSTPPPVPGEAELLPLSESDIHDIHGLLGLANPGTDARPFEYPEQHWVGARDGTGRLVACGVREPNVAGWPVLSGIAVDPAHRGRGLGLAVTAHLTRGGIDDRGVCTLGLYSSNDVARRLYHGLGYGQDHLWSSRRLAT